MISGQQVLTYQWHGPRRRKLPPCPGCPPKAARPKRPRVYNHPRELSLSVRILDLIEATPGGMTFRQIQRQLFAWANPELTYDPKLHRGWWCTNLYGLSAYGRKGLLSFYCEKQGKRWVRNKKEHHGKPFKTMNPTSVWQASYQYGTYIINSKATLTGVSP